MSYPQFRWITLCGTVVKAIEVVVRGGFLRDRSRNSRVIGRRGGSTISGVVTWNRVRAVYERTAATHAKAAQLVGLACPPSVFSALFHDRYQDTGLARVLAEVDLSRVEWTLTERSGTELRQVFVDRAFQPAVDEAYRGVMDSRMVVGSAEVCAGWRTRGTWAEPPILMAGEVLGLSVREVLLVGATRVGGLWAMLDAGVVAEAARHTIWCGHLE